MITNYTKSIFVRTIAVLIALSPVSLASAQAVTNLQGLFDLALRYLNELVPILIGLALILFFWGIIQYLMAGDNANKRSEAIPLIIWGIVALTVMVAVWAIVAILLGVFGFGFALPAVTP